MDWAPIIEQYGLLGVVVSLVAREASAWVRQTRGRIRSMSDQVAELHDRVPTDDVIADDRRRLDEVHRFLSTRDPDGQRVSLMRHLNGELIQVLTRALGQQTEILRRMDERAETDASTLREIRERLAALEEPKP